MLGFGVWHDQGTDFSQFGGGFFPGFNFVNRAPNMNPSNDGQFGAKFSWYFPSLLDGTEFGLYYMNYHSRLPMVNGFTGTQAGVGNALGAGTRGRWSGTGDRIGTASQYSHCSGYSGRYRCRCGSGR